MTYVEFFDRTSVENICACLINTPKTVVLVGTDEKEYVFTYFSFGLVAIIEKWIEKDCEDDILKIAGIMKNVIGYRK